MTGQLLPALILVGVVGVLVVGAVAPQANGPLVLTQILEPFLLLAAVPLAIVATRSRLGRVASVLLVGFALVRLAPVVVSLPGEPSGEPATRLISWNLQGDKTPTDELLDVLRRTSADVVALQEVTKLHAAAVEQDPNLRAAYPFRVVHPEGRYELAVLSATPILDSEVRTDPKLLRATLDLGGRPIVLFDGHPLPARFETPGPLPIPVSVDATRRDDWIRTVREAVDAAQAAGSRVIVVGDFNVTEREPAYTTLAGGLRDAHLEVGWGPGFSWRPGILTALPLGVMRIDYILTSAEVRPLAIDTDCTVRGGDHCLVVATLQLPQDRISSGRRP